MSNLLRLLAKDPSRLQELARQVSRGGERRRGALRPVGNGAFDSTGMEECRENKPGNLYAHVVLLLLGR